MRDPTTTPISRDDLDEVAQAALDSFPASDPPGWPGLRLGPPAAQPRCEPNDLDEDRGVRPTRIDELRVERSR